MLNLHSLSKPLIGLKLRIINTGISRSKFRSYVRNIIFAIVVYAIFSILISQGVINNYYQDLLILICINATVTVALNLATGLLGELALGHAGFMAIGAYTAALIDLNSELPAGFILVVGMIAGAILAGVAGLLVGVPALRLRGDYLAISTLAFGEIIRILLRSFKVTGGALGLNGIELSANFGSAYWLLIFVIYVVYALIRSRHGRAILAIREDDIAAEASGVNITRYKLLAFVTSAALTGLAGAVYAHHQGVITPQQFDYNYSIDFMVMVVFGGMGSITGSVLAAILLTLLPELLRGFSDYRMLVYAILLITLMIFKPSGLLGQKEISQRFFQNLYRRIRGKSYSKVPVNGSTGTAMVDIQELVEKQGFEGYLTEQGLGDLGVGGVPKEQGENVPLPGTPASMSGDIEKIISEDIDEEAVQKAKRGRR